MSELLAEEIFGLLTVRQLLVIIHLFGLALGAGSAFFSDFLFTNILKDKKVSKDEFRLLSLTSRVVWIGLITLTISGALLFLGDVDRLTDSSKFLAKMSIVGILLINGIVFHFYHLPMLKRYRGKNLAKSPGFRRKSLSFFISGAISGVSWAAALILGSLSFVDLSYVAIMAIYGVAVVLASVAALRLRKHYLPV